MSSPKLRNAAGLSLIELMIGLALGLLVLAGVLTVFASSRAAYQMGSSNARLQESMRFGLELIKPEIREATSSGFCAGAVTVNNHFPDNIASCDTALVLAFTNSASVLGWEAVGTDQGDSITIGALTPPTNAGLWASLQGATVELPQALVGRVVPQSDVLLLRTIRPVPGITGCRINERDSGDILTCGIRELSALNQPDSSAEHPLPRNQVTLVTNCATNSELFQNTGTDEFRLAADVRSCSQTGPGNSGTGWLHRFRDDTQVFSVTVAAYYVGFNEERGQPGLYRLLLDGTGGAPEELVEGVENMQLLYGISDTSGRNDGRSVDEWVRATRVPDWDRVIALRISMLARSPDPADPVAVAQTLDVNGTLITTPADRRLRQTANATIAFRTRVLVP